MEYIPCLHEVSPINVEFSGFVELDSLIILVYFDLKKYVTIHVFQRSTFRDFFAKMFGKKLSCFLHFFVSAFFLNILRTAEIFQWVGFVQFFTLYRLVYFSGF